MLAALTPEQRALVEDIAREKNRRQVQVHRSRKGAPIMNGLSAGPELPGEERLNLVKRNDLLLGNVSHPPDSSDISA